MIRGVALLNTSFVAPHLTLLTSHPTRKKYQPFHHQHSCLNGLPGCFRDWCSARVSYALDNSWPEWPYSNRRLLARRLLVFTRPKSHCIMQQPIQHTQSDPYQNGSACASSVCKCPCWRSCTSCTGMDALQCESECGVSTC